MLFIQFYLFLKHCKYSFHWLMTIWLKISLKFDAPIQESILFSTHNKNYAACDSSINCFYECRLIKSLLFYAQLDAALVKSLNAPLDNSLVFYSQLNAKSLLTGALCTNCSLLHYLWMMLCLSLHHCQFVQNIHLQALGPGGRVIQVLQVLQVLRVLQVLQVLSTGCCWPVPQGAGISHQHATTKVYIVKYMMRGKW